MKKITLTDEELIQGFLKNNKKHQEIIFKKYFGKLCTVAYCYVGREHYKDIVQDSFIKFFNHIKDHDGKNISAWLRRITVNSSIDYLRRNKTNFVRIDNTQENNINYLEKLVQNKNTNNYKTDPDENNEYFNLIKYKISEQELLDMISNLSPTHRTIFNLFVFEEMPHKQIAETLGISVGTSKSGLFNARQNLIKELNKRIKRKRVTN